jgi:hypothetical protein
MLKLRALEPRDGWAFVARNGEVLLIKPPYRESNVTGTSELVLKRAITEYGFDSLDVDFSSWEDLLQYVKSEITKNATETKTNINFEYLGADILRLAPLKTIKNLVARLQNELVPQGEWGAALQVLKALQRLEIVQRNAELQAEITALFAQCAEGALRKHHCYEELQLTTEQEIKAEFPLAAVAHKPSEIKKLAQRIANEHQIVAIGA